MPPEPERVRPGGPQPGTLDDVVARAVKKVIDAVYTAVVSAVTASAVH